MSKWDELEDKLDRNTWIIGVLFLVVIGGCGWGVLEVMR
jgi:hypothetical protein